MKFLLRLVALIVVLGSSTAVRADELVPDTGRDILVTFVNDGASAMAGSIRAPYQARRRYSIAASTRRDAEAVATAYALEEVDHWPIRALSVYCFVYRVPEDRDRDDVIDELRGDERIESVQPLQEFETGTNLTADYNDTLVNLQHGLDLLDIAAAHRLSRGNGIRVAIIDSQVDKHHEDLEGRLRAIRNFAANERSPEREHGTAVASVIGANANNAKGIVGVAPEADLELFVSCWAEVGHDQAVCDSFTLAKALDTLIEDPPHVLNLSLAGPDDPLVRRLIEKVLQLGVIVVAANPSSAHAGSSFPARLDGVIGVGTASQTQASMGPQSDAVYAPGNQIMVAVPSNAYDFRSGSSLAAAHVSGVVALMLSVSPGLDRGEVMARLQHSQSDSSSPWLSIDACRALHGAGELSKCESLAANDVSRELKPRT